MSTNYTPAKRLDASQGSRRGAIAVLAAVLMIVLLAMIVFAVDLGYMMLARAEIQNAADAAAMAAAANLAFGDTQVVDSAEEFANRNRVGGRQVAQDCVNVEFGTWDLVSRTFSPSTTLGNAVRVDVQRDTTHDGQVGLFFAPVLGRRFFSVGASAVAMSNPRDIAFVVDLSGSMNNDSEPCWATAEIDNEFGALYPDVATQLMQQVYDDFGYGAFPGVLKYVGEGKVTADQYAYAELTKNGALSGTPYQILASDTEATRKQKAYKWIMNNQLPVAMPGVTPVPNSANAASYAYWEKYLDYIIKPVTLNSGSTGKGRPRKDTTKVTLPYNQASYRIDSAANPYTDAFPEADTTAPSKWQNKLGFRTYVQFMMDYGRDVQPVSGQWTPLSTNSSLCPRHMEDTEGGDFSFPPREQPTHASRRAIIAALQVIKERNGSLGDANQRDWVSVITFDKANGVTLVQPLTADYDAAMQACTNLQAVADNVQSTATESGLLKAKQHLASTAEGGQGRFHTNKVVVFLTDGIPNLCTSSDSTINNYISAHPSDQFFTSGTYKDEKNAALMQSMAMQLKKWMVFPVGIGLGTEYGFMDHAAVLGGTANRDGQCPRGSGNPAVYEQRLKEIFENIISNPKARLVQ